MSKTSYGAFLIGTKSNSKGIIGLNKKIKPRIRVSSNSVVLIV